jgi:hypothetical protein
MWRLRSLSVQVRNTIFFFWFYCSVPKINAFAYVRFLATFCRLLTVGFHEVRSIAAAAGGRLSNGASPSADGLFFYLFNVSFLLSWQMSHAFMGVLTGARIHSIELDRAYYATHGKRQKA